MNETNDSFSQTRQDLSNLKSTALDAAKDIGSTASVHARKAKGNLESLAANAQRETGDQLESVKGTLAELGEAARDYIAARPLAAIGAAVVFGFLLGRFRSSRS